MIDANGSSASEIDEFRNALSVVAAVYNGDEAEYKIVRQLIRDPENYVRGVESVASLLMHVIDASGTDAQNILDKFRMSAALANGK
jgi:hypothetical protein